MRDRRVDGVFRHIAPGPFIVGRQPAAERPQPRFHDMGDLPGPGDDLTDPAHRLRVGGGDRQRAHVVQNVLGRDGGRPDAGFGEGQVFGHLRIEVVADQQHVEVLVDGVLGVRQRRIGGRRQHVRFTGQLQDVGGVTATRALRVERVDRASGDRLDGRLDEAGLVQRIRVQGDLQPPLISGPQRGVQGGRSRAPVLVHLVTARPGQGLLSEPLGAHRVALAQQQHIHRERVHRPMDEAQMPGPRRHRGGLGALGRAGATAADRRDAGRQGLDGLRRRNHVDVRVEPARGQDLALAADDLGGRADLQLRVDAVADIGVAGPAERDDRAVLDADIGLHDSPPVEHDRIRDDRIRGAFGAGDRTLQHRLADRLASAEDGLVASDGQVFLDLDPQVGVGQPDLIPAGRPVQRGVLLTADLHLRPPWSGRRRYRWWWRTRGADRGRRRRSCPTAGRGRAAVRGW